MILRGRKGWEGGGAMEIMEIWDGLLLEVKPSNIANKEGPSKTCVRIVDVT